MQSKLWDDLVIVDEYMGKVCRIAVGHVVACDPWMKWYSEDNSFRVPFVGSSFLFKSGQFVYSYSCHCQLNDWVQFV